LFLGDSRDEHRPDLSFYPETEIARLVGISAEQVRAKTCAKSTRRTNDRSPHLGLGQSGQDGVDKDTATDGSNNTTGKVSGRSAPGFRRAAHR
jgi:hypothetical protein